MSANINTRVSTKNQEIKDRASFFYNLIQLRAHNDILTNTMNMTNEEKQHFLSSEINHYLPFFHKLPDRFKKWTMSHHNISPELKELLLPKMKISLNKKGGSLVPVPVPAPRPSIISQQPSSIISQPMARAIGQIWNAEGALKEQQSVLSLVVQQQQSNISNMISVVAMHTEASKSSNTIFSDNIKTLQEHLKVLETKLDETKKDTKKMVDEVTQRLEQKWGTAVKDAREEHELTGKKIKDRVTNFETKNTKAKLCGSVCGGISGWLVHDLVIAAGNAVDDVFSLPEALATSASSFGDTTSGIMGTWNMSWLGDSWAETQPGAIIGKPIEWVGAFVGSASSTFATPIKNLVTNCNPQCGALIGIGCCICTSAICITLLQEHEGVSERLKSESSDNQWAVTRALYDGAKKAQLLLEASTVIPLLVRGTQHSKSADYKKAIKDKEEYNISKTTFIPYIKQTDMVISNRLVDQQEWINKALKINKSLIDLASQTNILNEDIDALNKKIISKMERREDTANNHRHGVVAISAPDRFNAQRAIGAPIAAERLTEGIRRRPKPRPRVSMASGPKVNATERYPLQLKGGYLKSRVKSKRLERNKKSKHRRTKHRSTKHRRTKHRRTKHRSRRN